MMVLMIFMLPGRKSIINMNYRNQIIDNIYHGMIINNAFKVLKTLVIEEQISQKTEIVNVQVPLVDGFLLVEDILKDIAPSMSNRRIKTYDFIKNEYVDVAHYFYQLPLIILHPSNLILLKISNQINSTSVSNSLNSSQILDIKSEASSKKERSKERVLFQVIEIVKKWRQIHMNKNTLKKVSLQQAAKIIGLPKKSLDDYYYHLRLGQKYDFDFRAHLFDRIGVLRTYLKNLKENSHMIKNEKHPKKLKILQEFDQIEVMFNANKNLYGNYGRYNEMQQQNELSEQKDGQMKEEHLDDEQSKGIQDNFYNEFQYFLNEKDPFLSGDYNFKKKTYQDNNSQQLFF